MDLPLTTQTIDTDDLVGLTVDVVSAYVGHNSLNTVDLPKLISDTYSALKGLSQSPQEQPSPELVPAVSIRKSVTPDYIICLDDGKKFKSMKRHISALAMTPDEYRAKWKLPHDYPMVAPSYASTRSALAVRAGLGRKPDKAKAETQDPKRKARTKH